MSAVLSTTEYEKEGRWTKLSDHGFQLTLSFEPVLFGSSHRLKHCTEVWIPCWECDKLSSLESNSAHLPDHHD